MKIAFITGSYPPDLCGVGHFTHCLVDALKKQGISVEVMTDEDWSLRNVAALLKRVRSMQSDITHLQYPTIGFGASLAPQALSLLAPGIVTLHEITQAHILRRLSLYPFSLRSRHIIFTSEFEQAYALGRAPWIKQRCSIIPIGNNMPIGDLSKGKDLGEIVYFGMVRPHKGVEDVLHAASIIHNRALPLKIRIIGKPHPKSIAYYEELRRRSGALPVVWNIDLVDDAVADLLARSAVAYMPFPDGASERRGSLLALMANGVAVITTSGAATPDTQKKAVLISQNPEHAVQLMEQLMADRELQKTLSSKGLAYAAYFAWDSIARKHKTLYETILNTNTRSPHTGKP
jgi:glycosyltransferase involved in cell wall biosynthesis